MAVPFGVFSFSKGEIAPGLFGRVDQSAYHASATTYRNMFAHFAGGARSRAGTKFVGFSKQTGNGFPPRLIDFQFSILQGLALEFGHQYMRVISNGAFVTNQPVPITGASNTSPCIISVTASGGASALPVNAGVTQTYAPGDAVTLAGGSFTAPAVLDVLTTLLLNVSSDAPGAGYVPGDMIVPSGGVQAVLSQLTVLTTKVVSASVAAAGAGGTNGVQVVTGTTGTGTHFQATVSIVGGAIDVVISVTLAGSYTVNPINLTNEPVTGAFLAGAQLTIAMGVHTIDVTGGGSFSTNPTGGTFTQLSTSGFGSGATFSGALMAPATLSFLTPGVYTALPSNPVSQLATSGIGLNAEFTVAWGASPAFANGSWVAISGVDGMTELNGNTYVLGSVGPTSAALFDVYGNPVDATAFGVYLSGGVAAEIFTLDTPWAEADLPWLKWKQSADVMSICCRNQQTGTEYPPQDLSRIADDDWLLVPTTFSARIAAPGNSTATPTVLPTTGTSPPIRPTAYAYVVTAVSQGDSAESVASPIANIVNGVDIAATAGSNIIDWDPVSGAAYYNVYKAPASYNTSPGNPNLADPVPAGALFGFVGASYGTQFVDSNITADGAQVPPLHTDPFARGVIRSVKVTSFGSGLTTFVYTIFTATGSGAVLQEVIVGGFLTAMIVIDGGHDYLPTDTIVFGSDGENAVGDIAFTLNPNNGDTITLGGQVWTFVTAPPGAQETRIQGSLSATLTQLVTDLSVSTNGIIQECSYFATSTELQIHYGVPGTIGNLFTLAASAGTPSGPALTGGGAANIPQGFLNVGPEAGTYPSVVSYYQQRRVYAASANAPDTYEMSQPGRFTNFDRRIPTIDSDAITGTPWSQQVNGIQHFLSMPGGLLTFTGNQMWQLTGAGGSGLTPVAITPVDQQAQPQAFNGISATLPPMQIGYDVLFADAVGSYVYDVSYQYWLNIYTGNDITVFSSHLFDGFTLKEWAWARQPYKLVWAVRDDGAALSLTFDKEQEVIGWTRHDTQGLFQSVCTVIEPPVNAPYVAVERFIGSAPAGGGGGPPSWSAINLGIPFGALTSQAAGASATGSVVVGHLFFSDGQRAVYWDSSNTSHLLPEFPAAANVRNAATACSADGTIIVGYSVIAGINRRHAVYWSNGPAWVIHDLGVLGGIGDESFALGCSADASLIVGANSGFPTSGPCYWAAFGALATLPAPGNNYAALGCSADGTIIVGGSTSLFSSVTPPVKWTGGPAWSLTSLDDIVGSVGPSTANVSSASGGVVAGSASNGGGQTFAASWSGTTLTLIDAAGSFATGCDSTGVYIVGQSSAPEAAVWISGVSQALPLFAGATDVLVAVAISTDHGTIAGNGTDGDGNATAVKWTLNVSPPTGGAPAYTIERMDNRLWLAAENCWCVDCALALPHTYPNATLTITSSTGAGRCDSVTALAGGTGYSAGTTASVIDDDGEGHGIGAVPTLTIAAGVVTSVVFAPGNKGSGYVRPALVITDPSGTGSGASATIVLDNSLFIQTNAAIFSGGDIGKVVRAGRGIMVVQSITSSSQAGVNMISPVLQTIPGSGGVPLPQATGRWSMDRPVSTISGLGHLANAVVTGLADGNVISPRQVSATGVIVLDAPATEVVIGLGFQAQLQSPYLAEVAVQGQRKRIAEVTARIEASRGIKIGSNQPDASTLSPAPLIAQWSDLADAPDLGVPPYGSTTPPLYTGDVRIPIHGGYEKPGQAAVQQDFPLPMNILALIHQDDLGDIPQGGKPAAKSTEQQQRRGFAFQPVGPAAPPYAR